MRPSKADPGANVRTPHTDDYVSWLAEIAACSDRNDALSAMARCLAQKSRCTHLLLATPTTGEREVLYVLPGAEGLTSAVRVPEVALSAEEPENLTIPAPGFPLAQCRLQVIPLPSVEARLVVVTESLAEPAWPRDVLRLIGALVGAVVARRQAARQVGNAQAQAREVACLHGLAEAMRNSPTLEGVCAQVVALIPPAWSRPEDARARIVLDDKTYVSEVFTDTSWGQSSAIVANGWARGGVQVFYATAPPDGAELFLPEERRLLDTIARTLGEALQRREAEAELRARTQSLAQERNRFETVLRSIGEGVIVTDSLDRVLLMNRAAQELLAHREEEPLGVDLFDLIDDESFKANWQESARQGRDLAREELIVARGGVRALWAFRSRVPDLAAGRHGYVTILRDVTREREIDRMKTDFVSAVSHELRTPLTSIKGFASTLKQKDDVPADLRQRFLGIIDEEADRLSTLIEELLVMARIESGRVILGYQPVDIGQVVEQVVASVGPLARRKGIRLHHNVAPDLPRPLGDPEKIRIVVVNLMENAVKFTLAGGNITIRALKGAKEVTIEVEDSGLGIPEGELQRIFDRFHRVHRPGRQEAGTGLGLFIAREMVRLHGGHIDVRSAVGKGSVFSVFLPLAGGKAAKPNPETPE